MASTKPQLQEVSSVEYNSRKYTFVEDVKEQLLNPVDLFWIHIDN